MNAQPSPTPKAEERSAAVRARAFALISERSFLRGNFVLASGQTSGYFLDMKPRMFHPEGSHVLAELLLEQMSDGKADYGRGPATGAAPPIRTPTMPSHKKGSRVSCFFVRKEVKDHGTRKLLEALRKD